MQWYNSLSFIEQNVEQTLAELASDGLHITLEELLLYQSQTALVNRHLSRKVASKMAGGYLSRHKGRGMEFDEVRLYQNGDDVRTIDWRVTARTGKTYTKLFREEVERPVIIACDLSAIMQFGSALLYKSVQAAHLTALLAWHAKSKGDRLGGIVFNNEKHIELKPRARQVGVLRYLHALVELQQPSTNFQEINQQVFEDNCARLRFISHPGSLVYLITDGHQLTTNAIRHLRAIAQHSELIVCHISDPLELSLPRSQQKITVAITDKKQTQLLTLGDQQTENEYRLQAMAQLKSMQQSLLDIGARVEYFTAGQSIASQLKQGANLWIR